VWSFGGAFVAIVKDYRGLNSVWVANDASNTKAAAKGIETLFGNTEIAK
jgi:hypothetical protein